VKVVQDPSVAWVADAWCAEANVRPGDVAFGFLRVPLDYAVSYRPGTRFGPAAIMAELGEWSLFCTDKRVSLDGVRLVDLGEVDVVHSLETTYGRIRSAVASIGPSLTPVVLGGDHSISDPVVRGLADRLGSAPAVVVFDAHFDSRDPVPGKEHSGHWMRTLGDVVDYSLVAQVGISSYLYSEAYLADAEAKGVLVRTPYEIRRAGWPALVDQVCAHVSAAPAVYVSVDIDCLDQTAAPGTSAVNPIGLLPYEVVDAVFELASRLPVVGLDVVEVSPPLDPSGATARVAAAIVLNFMAGTVVRSRAAAALFEMPA
jgi:agmatinase